MAIKTIKTTEEEANRIIENKVSFVIRNKRYCFQENDIIQFRVIKDLHDVLHKIDSRKYLVTFVTDYKDAPIVEGYQFISFREV